MRPATGTHNLRRLRECLGLTQVIFAKETGLSLAQLCKIEHVKVPLSATLAQRISERTGVSLAWLTRNDKTEPVRDSKNQPYTKAHFERLKISRSVEDYSALKRQGRSFLARSVLLDQYSKARDLFLLPEMYPHLGRYLIELGILYSRYAAKADSPPNAEEFREQETKRRETLYSDIARDIELCLKAEEELRPVRKKQRAPNK